MSEPADFERAYGPEGEWAQFFRAGPGYVGTELLRDAELSGRYLVVDRWESRDAYNAFVESHRDEYMRRVDETAFNYDRELEVRNVRERLVTGARGGYQPRVSSSWDGSSEAVEMPTIASPIPSDTRASTSASM